MDEHPAPEVLALQRSACQTGVMNAAELRLSYKADDEWAGELTAVVKSGGFSGEGAACNNSLQPASSPSTARSTSSHPALNRFWMERATQPSCRELRSELVVRAMSAKFNVI